MKIIIGVKLCHFREIIRITSNIVLTQKTTIPAGMEYDEWQQGKNNMAPWKFSPDDRDAWVREMN